VVAGIALFASLGGGAYAASTYIITSHTQIKPNVLRYLKTQDRGKRGPTGAAGAQGLQGSAGIAGVAGTNGLAGMNGAAGLTGDQGVQGDVGATGAPGVVGPRGLPGFKGDTGATGLAGATGATGPAEMESTRQCTPTLCIDADPASGGSGGWGWNPTVGNVTDLTVGQTYPFTVTVIQDGNENADGSITLTWNPTDFTGPLAGNDGTCATTSTGNALSCTYTDLSHQYKGDSFSFTALSDNPDAQVVATVEVNGEEASATFPVAITG
jgi:hypothetical protein